MTGMRGLANGLPGPRVAGKGKRRSNGESSVSGSNNWWGHLPDGED